MILIIKYCGLILTLIVLRVECNYEVEKENSYNISQKFFPAPMPQDVKVLPISTTSIKVTWGPPLAQDSNGTTKGYCAHVQEIDEDGISLWDEPMRFSNLDNSLLELNISGLEPNTNYSIEVLALTPTGDGDKSSPIIVKTLGSVPCKPFLRLKVTGLELTATIELDWTRRFDTNGELQGFRLRYGIKGQGLKEKYFEGPLTRTYQVNVLERGEYEFRIAAQNHNGFGQEAIKYLQLQRYSEAEQEVIPLSLRSHDVTTHSMTLSWSPPIRINPVNYKISFDAVKEFVDSQGITQTQTISRKDITLESTVRSFTINELTPFTTYNVNVSAISADYQCQPPAKIMVTTQMAAPKPIVKPDFNVVNNAEEIQVILPIASEEFGPISYYYLIVVPENNATDYEVPDQIVTEDIISNGGPKTEFPDSPYIADKFPSRNVPFTYILGSGEVYNEFINRKLERGKKYRIFVRAVLDFPPIYLYTSSPFSEYLSLDMSEVPSGTPQLRS